MRIGFIGTGVITRAVVLGLLRSDLAVDRIVLSPRNAETAAELAALDDRVSVAASNQDVLDAADIVCVAVVPQIVEDVLVALDFAPRHRVITFVPVTSHAALRGLVAPAQALARAVPLPSVADLQGTTAVFPYDEVAVRIFDALGSSVVVEGEREFDALHAVTSTMASHYAVLEAQASWLVEQGLPYPSARAFLAGYSFGLAADATASERSFAAMIDYLMTPGGLNEQVHAELTAAGAYDHYGPALDRVFARVRGTSVN